MLAFERQLRRGGPVFAAVPVASHVAAHGAVQGIVAALFARAPRRRRPARRDEPAAGPPAVRPRRAAARRDGRAQRRWRRRTSSPPAATYPTLNYHPVMAGDGRWIQCGNLLEHLLMAFLDATDLLGELLADERFLEPIGTWDEATVAAARDMMLVRLQERPADEWMAIFRADGNIAAEPFLTTAEALHHPDLVGGGDIVTIDDPTHGAGAHDRPDRRADRHPRRHRPPRPHPRPTHRRGARPSGRSELCTCGRIRPHAQRVDGSGHDPGRRRRTAARRDHDRRVLDDHRRADRHRHARRPRGPGDQGRGARRRPVPPPRSPAAPRWPRRRPASRRSASTSRPTRAGAIARQLCAGADIVVHNARPGVPERLGLGEEQLRADNPDLIWVSLTGLQPPQPGRPAPVHPPVRRRGRRRRRLPGRDRRSPRRARRSTRCARSPAS